MLFQTRNLTAMDIWMFTCMIFVFLAKLEYAMQLKAQFGGSYRNKKIGGNKNKIMLEKRCQKIDFYALITFTVAYTFTVGAYFYIYT